MKPGRRSHAGYGGTNSRTACLTVCHATLVGFLVTSGACAPAGGTNGKTKRLVEGGEHSLLGLNIVSRRFLPDQMQGYVTPVPWTAGYYPAFLGGTAARWNQNFDEPPAEPEVWSEETQRVYQTTRDAYDAAYQEAHRDYTPVNTVAQYIDLYDDDPHFAERLSAAEKFQVYSGIDGFAQRILDRNFASSPSWMGHCNSWSIAALHYDEPGDVTVMVEGPDGKTAPLFFGSEDIKALLIQNIEYFETTPGERLPGGFVGLCNIEGVCEDQLNPATLHIALSNLLGAKRQEERRGVIMELVPGRAKWNYPVFAFKSEDFSEKVLFPEELNGHVFQNPRLLRTTIRYRVEQGAFGSGRAGNDPETIREAKLCYMIDTEGPEADAPLVWGKYIVEPWGGRSFYLPPVPDGAEPTELDEGGTFSDAPSAQGTVEGSDASPGEIPELNPFQPINERGDPIPELWNDHPRATIPADEPKIRGLEELYWSLGCQSVELPDFLWTRARVGFHPRMEGPKGSLEALYQKARP